MSAQVAYCNDTVDASTALLRYSKQLNSYTKRYAQTYEAQLDNAVQSVYTTHMLCSLVLSLASVVVLCVQISR